MYAPPVTTGEARSLAVPPGSKVFTDYVPIEIIVLECRDRMAIGDVERALRKLLQMGDASSWPCPVGYWRGDRFVITDGRHEYVATMMIGRERIFVAWFGPVVQVGLDTPLHSL